MHGGSAAHEQSRSRQAGLSTPATSHETASNESQRQEAAEKHEGVGKVREKCYDAFCALNEEQFEYMENYHIWNPDAIHCASCTLIFPIQKRDAVSRSHKDERCTEATVSILPSSPASFGRSLRLAPKARSMAGNAHLARQEISHDREMGLPPPRSPDG